MVKMLRLCPLLLLILVILAVGGSSSKTATSEANPYRTLADYLLRSDRKNKDFIKYSVKEVQTAVKKLAEGQKTMKSVDGASHMINNAISDKKSSLTARYKKFEELDLEQESKSMQKEASKVLEYVNTVERSMQACEILQCIDEEDNDKRHLLLSYAGLKELHRKRLTHDKVTIDMSVLLPLVPTDGRFARDEIILAFIDKCSIENILRMCTKPTVSYPLNSIGLLSEEVTLLPVILELASQGVEHVREWIMPVQHLEFDEENKENGENLKGDKLRNKDKKNRQKRNTQYSENQRNGEKKNSNNNNNNNNKTKKEKKKKRNDDKGEVKKVSDVFNATLSISGTKLPKKIRTIGHSAGGAVASYVAMILDGVLSLEDIKQEVKDVLGSYKDCVRCITLASPPCISRNIVPRYVSSIICGDDIISRSHEESLLYMKKRVLSSLKTSSSLVGKIPGTTFLSDMAAVTGKGMSSYTGNAHDLESAHVPGRVFFMKKRKHKNGVSFQRVLRGNWREDMLWMLRDILLSARMFEHHTLDSYINTLMRC